MGKGKLFFKKFPLPFQKLGVVVMCGGDRNRVDIQEQYFFL